MLIARIGSEQCSQNCDVPERCAPQPILLVGHFAIPFVVVASREALCACKAAARDLLPRME